MISIVFQSFPSHFSGTLVVSAFEGRVLSVSARKVDTHLHGALTRALGVQAFSGKAREICTILAPAPDIDQVIVVGLGQEDACITRTLEEAGRQFFAQVRAKEAVVFLDPLPSIAQPALAFAEGALLRSWRFTKYRTTKPEESPLRITSLTFAVEDVVAAERAFAPLLQRAQGVFAAQDLVSEPANILYPESFALRAQEELAPLGVRVEILDGAQLKKIGMGALLGVAQGSTREPRVVVLEWKGPGAQGAPIAFAGKGLTFDSGGIDLKPQKGMEEMIHDMAGAAVVFGFMKTLALRKAPVHTVGILGLAENMPSGSAQRPGDIVKTLSGKTVHVLNTDAEGRLVLADILWYTCDRFNPRILIDLATLTGAISVALGSEFAGLFANDDTLADHLLSCGIATGEKLWRLPMTKNFDKDIDTDVADVKNLGTSGEGGSITAAQFLKRFLKEPVSWAHLDIAGTSWTRKTTPLMEKGATGFGVRLLDTFIQQHGEC